jgi:DNA-binding transcriptional MocR family regulator
MSKRFKRKGKSKFVMLDGYILRSDAWLALGGLTQAAYLYFKIRYDGLNNGRVAVSCRDLAGYLRVSKNTANRAIDRLEEIGFISKVRASGFNMKIRLAAEWRLTEYQCDVTGELPTKTFMKWRSNEKSTVPPEGQQVPPQGQSVIKMGVNYGH